MAALATPYIAVTDQNWFEYLFTYAGGKPLDEVNFWSPQATRPMKVMDPGTPVFFRLKSPVNAIVGYGFFAHFMVASSRRGNCSAKRTVILTSSAS